MKQQYSFKIDNWQLNSFFSPVRSKERIISLLLDTVKLMLINCEPKEAQVSGEIVLVVSKMSRLFYFTNDKYFSINFPFLVHDNAGSLSFSTRNKVNIDNFMISNIKKVLLNKKEFYSPNVYEFLEPIEEVSCNDSNFWSVLLELFLFEDGYIRYDCDVTNENGAVHPLHHYDVFYSSNSTFKIGLKNELEKETLIDLLQIETNCHFFE